MHDVLFDFNGRPLNPLTITQITVAYAPRDYSRYFNMVHPYRIRLYKKWLASLPWWKRMWLDPDKYKEAKWHGCRVNAWSAKEKVGIIDGFKSHKQALMVRDDLRLELDKCLKKFTNLDK